MLNHTKPSHLKIVPVISGMVVILAVILFTAMIQPGSSPMNNAAGKPGYSAGNQSTAVVVYPQNPSDTIYNVVDEMPEFPGGDKARLDYIVKNITYPEEARIQKTEGTVYISFVVEKDGSISNTKILRGIGNGCDEVVIEIIDNMPVWKPGMKDGNPVRTRFNMPVKFVIGEKVEPEEAVPASEGKKVTPSTQGDEDQAYVVVEKVAEFRGGPEALWEYMEKAVSYTDEARKAKVEGSVYINFIIEKDGTVSHAWVVRGLGSGLDEIALNAINNMPAWKPGKHKGKPVRVQFNMPVKFSLKKDEKE